MNLKARRLQELAGLVFDLYKVCFICPFLPLFPPRRTLVLSSAEESGIFILISSAACAFERKTNRQFIIKDELAVKQHCELIFTFYEKWFILLVKVQRLLLVIKIILCFLFVL